MNEEGHWITINGTHVFVKEGQNPMDAFIKQKSKKGVNDEVKNYEYIDTGIANFVATGKLKDGNYFVMDDDGVEIFDADFKKAFQEGLDMNWEKEHRLKSYNSRTAEYGRIGKNIKEIETNNVNGKELLDRIDKIKYDYDKHNFGQYWVDNATGIPLPVEYEKYGEGTWYTPLGFINTLEKDKKITKAEKDYLIRKMDEYKKKK